MNESYLSQQVDVKVEQLENSIRGISSAPTEFERNALIEIALAKVEGRKPENWAEAYINYATDINGHYF